MLYETWRDLEPLEVKTMENLTAASVREAHMRIPPSYIRFSLSCAQALMISLRE